MTNQSGTTASTIIPTMRYTDAPAAIKWLCKAFGFSEHLVVPGPDNTITHAQLIHNNGMIMLGSARDDDAKKSMTPPTQTNGVETRGIYMIVDDVDAHCQQARNADAKILIEPHDEPYGGRSYAAQDPEQHTWYFGTYNPWQSNDH